MFTYQLRSAWRFFQQHAGYSVPPGRAMCALSLARAERAGKEAGLTFVWDHDGNDSSEWSDDPEPWLTWECLCYDANEDVVASLCGIDFGRDGTPWNDPYKRVVEAELASEALAAVVS